MRAPHRVRKCNDITHERPGGERLRVEASNGQLVPLYALVVLIACGATLLLVRIGVLTVHRAHARTAADAAALAGAAEGRAGAEEIAADNGAVLEFFVTDGDEVEVRVRVGTTHATARARREGGCQVPEPQHVHFASCQPTSPG